MNITPPTLPVSSSDEGGSSLHSDVETRLEAAKSPRKNQNLPRAKSLGTAEKIKRYYEVSESPLGSTADTTNIFMSSSSSIKSGPHIPTPVHGPSPLAYSGTPRNSSLNETAESPKRTMSRAASSSFNITRASIIRESRSPGRSPRIVSAREILNRETDHDAEQEDSANPVLPIPKRSSDSSESMLSLALPRSGSSSPTPSARSGGGSSPTFPTYKQVIVKGNQANPNVVRLRPSLDLQKMLEEQEARQAEQEVFLARLERIYRNTPRPRSPSYLDLISARKQHSAEKKKDKIVTIVDERPSSDRAKNDPLDSPQENKIDIESLKLVKSAKDFDKGLIKALGIALKNCTTAPKTPEELETLVLEFAKKKSEDDIKSELNKDGTNPERKSRIEILGEFFIKESPKAKDILWMVQKSGVLLDYITIRLQACRKALIKYHDLHQGRTDKSLKLYNVLGILIRADKYLNEEDRLEGVTDLVSFIKIIDEEIKKDKELLDFLDVIYKILHPDKKTAENVLGTLRKWADNKNAALLKPTVQTTSIHYIKLVSIPYTEHNLTKSERIKCPEIAEVINWLTSSEVKNKLFINGELVSCRIEKNTDEKNTDEKKPIEQKSEKAKVIDLIDEKTRVIKRLLRLLHISGFETDKTVTLEYVTKKADTIFKGELPKYAKLLCLCMLTREQIDGCLKLLYPALYQSTYLASPIKELPEVECHININPNLEAEVTQIKAYGIYEKENPIDPNSNKINPARHLCTFKIMRTISPEDNRERVLIFDIVMNDNLVTPEERYKIEEILINWADPEEKFIEDLKVIHDGIEQLKFDEVVEKYLERILKGVNFFNPSVYSMEFGIANLCRQRVESLGRSGADLNDILKHSKKIAQIAKEVVDSIQVENSGVLLGLIIKGLELLSRELQEYLKLKGQKTEMCEKLIVYLRDLIASNKYLKDSVPGKKHLGSFLKILKDIKDKNIKNIIFFALTDTGDNPLTVLEELQKWHQNKGYKHLIAPLTRMIQDYQLMEPEKIKQQKHVFQETAAAEFLIRKIKFQEILRNVEDKKVLFREVKVNGIPVDLANLETTDDVRCEYFTRLLYLLQTSGMEIIKIDKNTYSDLDGSAQKTIRGYVARIKGQISEGKGFDLIDNCLTSDEVKLEYLTRMLYSLQSTGIQPHIISQPRYKDLDTDEQKKIKGYIDQFKPLMAKGLAFDLTNLEPNTEVIRREYLMRLLFQLYRAGLDQKIKVDKPAFEELDVAVQKTIKSYVDRILTVKTVPYEQMVPILTAEPILCVPLLLISTNSTWLLLEANIRKRFPDLYNDIRINPWSEGGITCNYLINRVTGQTAVEIIRQYAVYRKTFPESEESTTINRDRCLAMITLKGTFTPKDQRYWFQADQEQFPTLCSSCLEILDLEIRPIANTEEKWRIWQALLEFENEPAVPERKGSTPRDSPRNLSGMSPRSRSQIMAKIPKLAADGQKPSN